MNIKKQLVEVSKLMYQKGMVNAFEGNLSILFKDKIYITPSGICKGFLKENMIIVTDMNGNVIKKSKFKPSSEIKMHLAIYQRQDVSAVIHAHSPYATAFAIANKPIETKAYSEMMLFFGKIPLSEFGTPSTDEVSIEVLKYAKDYEVILLANHGIVSFGKDLYSTFFKLEAAESIAKTLTITEILGGGKDLSMEKLEEINKLRRC